MAFAHELAIDRRGSEGVEGMEENSSAGLGKPEFPKLDTLPILPWPFYSGLL